MGANNSTRRVSFESDENENITVVKGIRLSENVINRMREPATPCKPNHVPTPPPSMAPTVTPPLFRPVPPLFDPITSMPAPPPVVESVTPPPSEPPTENVTAPTVIDTVFPSSPSPATAKPVPAPALEPVVAPPPAPAAIEQPPVEPESSSPVPEPVVAPESSSTPPNPPAPPVDEEALKKKITDEMHEGFEQDRTKAEQELQAWLEEEKARIRAKIQTEAQSQVQDEVSRILSAERALAQESLQQTLIRERLVTENERRRAELFAKQLDAREADLQKQDAFYKQQVARLEERSAQFYKVTTENYHKAADQVNAKFKRYEIHPVCADLQGQILSCYKENIGKTLNCSNIATLYLQCVNNAKQNKLRTGG